MKSKQILFISFFVILVVLLGVGEYFILDKRDQLRRTFGEVKASAQTSENGLASVKKFIADIQTVNSDFRKLMDRAFHFDVLDSSEIPEWFAPRASRNYVTWEGKLYTGLLNKKMSDAEIKRKFTQIAEMNYKSNVFVSEFSLSFKESQLNILSENTTSNTDENVLSDQSKINEKIQEPEMQAIFSVEILQKKGSDLK